MISTEVKDAKMTGFMITNFIVVIEVRFLLLS
jgi:hypothetical protein